MKQKEIIAHLAAGGYILNTMLIQPNRRVHPQKISGRQIKALEDKGLVTKTIGYDKLQTYRLK